MIAFIMILDTLLCYHLSNYNVIILDKIIMVPINIFRHILHTLQELPMHPILMVSRDKYQQQPIETIENRIVPASNIFYDSRFPGMCVNFTLHLKQRCNDPQYQEILNHLRYWRPTRSVLAKVNSTDSLEITT